MVSAVINLSMVLHNYWLNLRIMLRNVWRRWDGVILLVAVPGVRVEVVQFETLVILMLGLLRHNQTTIITATATTATTPMEIVNTTTMEE